jgi:pyruvate kinase
MTFACANGVDFIGLSFIKDASDLKKVRAHLKKIKAKPFLISKIERRAAIANLKEIVHSTDGVMVARGDLGVELPIEKVNILQKEIIKKCNALGKPVITATQMLESMIENPSPTRAEVSDVANAIFDGTDAIMLSGETAVGKYPVQAVEMMYKIAKTVEPKIDRSRNVDYLANDDLSDIISKNVVRISEVYGVKGIILPTESGKTARMVSRYRPNARVIALASTERIQRQLVLPFGVYPCRIPKHANSSVIFKLTDKFIKKSPLFKKGDKLIIAAGTLHKKGNVSDFIKIMTVG